jgi:hypothetical protein
MLLTQREDDYKTLKNRLGNFVNHLGDLEQLTQLIQRDGEAATYECLRVTADCLHRTVVLHRNVFPTEHPEVFTSPTPERGAQLNLLFMGPWKYGHFLAVIPKDSLVD